MEIHKITIKNILGIKTLNIDPEGKAIIVRGRNGAGKTSFIRGLQTIIGGGNLARIKNMDAPEDEPAEGVIVLDGEQGQIRIERTEKRLRVQRQIGDTAGFEDVDAPQRWLNELFDAPAANPVPFLRARPKERVDLLLKTLHFDHDPNVLWASMGLDSADFSYPRGLDSMKEIEMIRKAVFDRRTDVNRDEKNARGTAEQIRRKIPAAVPSVDDLSEKENALSNLRRDYALSVQAAKKKAADASADAVRARNDLEEFRRHELIEFEADLKRELAEKIAARKEQISAEMEDARAVAEVACQIANDVRDIELAEAEVLNGEIARLSVELAEGREQQKSAIQIQTLASQAEEHENDAVRLEAESTKLTNALNVIDRYKAQLCENVPIPGLGFGEADATIDGVPWDQVNTERQYETAVAVSCLRFRDKPFRPIFVDGFEAMDSEHRALLLSKITAAGGQPIVTMVADCDLDVSTGLRAEQ